MTDRESGLAEVIAKEHSRVFHGMCEWHLGHSLDHFLLLDRVKNEQRKERVAELGRAVWGPASERAAAFGKLLESVKDCPKASAVLRNVAAYVTSERRPSGRTTSVIEREMQPQDGRRCTLVRAWGRQPPPA